MGIKNALLTTALCAIFAASSVGAQQTIPETPPELRDFRLDPERTPPKPEPQPTPAAPPAAVPTLPEANSSRPAPRQEPAPPRSAPPSTAAPTTQNIPPVIPVKEPLPEATPSPTVAEPGAPVIDETTAEPSSASSPSAQSTGWPIFVALGLGPIALLAFIFWRRRRRPSIVQPEISEPAIEEMPIESVPEIEAPRAQPLPVVKLSENKPSIMLQFIPEKATISFTTLTVKGQLQFINEGKSPAKDMQLRAGLISASADQAYVIADFHRNAASLQTEPLSETRAGERFAMAIELSVPLTELHSFPLGDQQLLVPIVIASLSYTDGGARQECASVACMIGREATPPQLKMAPLRLDLGPRSFAPLGQRPVLA